MPAPNYDFLIIGAGIFGLSSALELIKRGYQVLVLNPDCLPHPLAASQDISKAVRVEYGSDQEYFDMAEICMERWREWNSLLGETLFHEVGLLMLCQEDIAKGNRNFEYQSYLQLKARAYPCQRLDAAAIRAAYPVINSEKYQDACFNPCGGYVESGRVIQALVRHVQQLGTHLIEGQTVTSLDIQGGRVAGVKTREGNAYSCGQVILAAGAFSPVLLPELQASMRSTGHPVFHLKPSNPDLFKASRLPVFMADIATSGWYGFPLHPRQGVVKVAKHSQGLFLHPETDDRRVTDAEVTECREFLKQSFPLLADAPLVFTRRCLYTDTLDGHFWIDQHPHIQGLTVSTGGSGHAMKMGPLLGEMTADRAEGKMHRFSSRHLWRKLNVNTLQQEEARMLNKRHLLD